MFVVYKTILCFTISYFVCIELLYAEDLVCGLSRDTLAAIHKDWSRTVEARLLAEEAFFSGSTASTYNFIVLQMSFSFGDIKFHLYLVALQRLNRLRDVTNVSSPW